MRVRLSTLALVTVAMFDLVTTLMWLHAGQAEGNPFFASLASHGALPFALAKLALFIPPLLVLEWARTKRPLTAEIGTWLAAVGYAWMWGSHVIHLRR